MNVHRMIVISGLMAAAAGASASTVQLQITVTSLARTHGVAISPVTVAFHDGSFNPFSDGSAASLGIQNIAEFGNGTAYRNAFSASYPQGVAGVVAATTGGFGPGIYLPGASGSMTFTLDTAANGFINFGAMVVPSNDRFIGNAGGLHLLDNAGHLLVSSVTLHASDVWDAGTEVDAPFGAAFLVGQSAADHVAQNGVIAHNHDFSTYGGLDTPAGYVFDSALNANDSLVEFAFQVVPSPGTAATLGLAGLCTTRRRR